MEFTIVMILAQRGVMKIISLLGALAVLSLMMTPAFSQPSLSGCACMPEDCQGKPVGNSCSKASDICCTSLKCTCPGMNASYPEMQYYDPGYSHFIKSSSRSPVRPGSSGLTVSSNAGASFPASLPAADNIGPPDPDVVEYLPPSAKQVFLVLASDGPLTQKDIISKTDLPPRTVRYALGRLKGEEMLEERFCFSDARQSLYSLNGLDAK
jgi:hypothetical protein